MPLLGAALVAPGGAVERPQPRRQGPGVPGGRRAARTRCAPQEGDQKETGEPGLARGEPEKTDLTHGRPAVMSVPRANALIGGELLQ